MAEALRPTTADCLSCDREFTPRKLGHVYCSSGCRYAGPGQRVNRHSEAVKRLFDAERDPSEQVRAELMTPPVDREPEGPLSGCRWR
jgi:hypothetical protein